MNKKVFILGAALALLCLAGVNEGIFWPTRQGTKSLYVDPFGNNATAMRGRDDLPWQTPDAAASNALAGDTIVVRPGTYVCSNNIDIPNFVNMQCSAGALFQNYVKLDTNGIPGGPLVNFGTNSIVSGAIITNTLKDLIFQAGFGSRYSSGNKPFWNAQAVQCVVYGDSDAYYANHSNGCFATFTLCVLNSKWDAMAIQNTSGVNTPTHRTVLDRTRVHIQGVSVVNPSAAAHCYTEGTGATCTGQLFATNSIFFAAGGGAGSVILDGINSGAKTFDTCTFSAGSVNNGGGATITLINPTWGQVFENFIGDGNSYTFVSTPSTVRTIIDASHASAGIEFKDTDFFGGFSWRSVIGASSTFAGSVQATNGLWVRSNTLASIPTLLKGDAYLWSSNGVLYAICSSPSGVFTTNKIGP